MFNYLRGHGQAVDDEEEAVESETHPDRVEGAGVWDPDGEGRGWRMRRRGRSCGRGSVAWPGWAPASPPADSTTARPGSPSTVPHHILTMISRKIYKK